MLLQFQCNLQCTEEFLLNDADVITMISTMYLLFFHFWFQSIFHCLGGSTVRAIGSQFSQIITSLFQLSFDNIQSDTFLPILLGQFFVLSIHEFVVIRSNQWLYVRCFPLIFLLLDATSSYLNESKITIDRLASIKWFHTDDTHKIYFLPNATCS